MSGCAYSGAMQDISNAPTEILSSYNPQAAVICIQNGWKGRGFQLAISQLGIAARFHAGNWTAWSYVNWRN